MSKKTLKISLRISFTLWILSIIWITFLMVSKILTVRWPDNQIIEQLNNFQFYINKHNIRLIVELLSLSFLVILVILKLIKSTNGWPKTWLDTIIWLTFCIVVSSSYLIMFNKYWLFVHTQMMANVVFIALLILKLLVTSKGKGIASIGLIILLWIVFAILSLEFWWKTILIVQQNTLETFLNQKLGKNLTTPLFIFIKEIAFYGIVITLYLKTMHQFKNASYEIQMPPNSFVTKTCQETLK